MASHRYTHFEEAAKGALDKLMHQCASTLPDRKKFEPIETFLGKWIRTMDTTSSDHKTDTELATLVISRAGVEALHWFKQTDNPFNADDMVALICRKQHDYGHGNILNFGVIGIGVRICDKIARIKNLHQVACKANPKNESLVDSYHDIIGYAVIALMVEQGSFELKLRP